MKPHQILTLQAAYANRKEPTALWDNIAEQFTGDVWPSLKPSFSITSGETVFTIGSCFARNIEDNLASLGCRVPMLEFHLPPEEWHGRANGALNRFTPPTFRQAIEWTAAIHDRGGVVRWEEDCSPIAFDCGDDAYYDLDLVPTNPVSRERFIERRQHVYDVFKSALTADCFMMTPGYIEAWRDLQTGLYIQGAPKHRRVVAAGERLQFEVLSYEQSYRDLRATIELVRARNPAVKIIVTTSPVPLACTFTGDDVRTANTYSKSVLRAACGRLAGEFDRVDYFPSYESVALSAPDGVWQPDRAHVAPGFIGKIVRRLSDAYLKGASVVAVDLQEAETAFRSRDFEQAITASRRLLAVRPDHLAARLVLVDSLLAVESWADAEAEVRPLAAAHPDRADILYRMARGVIRQGPKRLPETVELARACARLPSATVRELNWTANLLTEHAKLDDEAEAVARLTVERFPRHAAAYRPLIDILVRSGRDEELLKVLQVAIDLPDGTARDRLLAARLLLKAGDLKLARNHALVAQRRNPKEPGLNEFLAGLPAPVASAGDHAG